MRRALGIVLAFTLLGFAPAALADVPPEMSVQGRLTNNAGAPVPAGLKNFTFKIFDQQTGGIEIWPAGPGELQTLSTDANGLWNVGVGSVVPLTEAVFQAPVRWLEVTVNDGVNPAETLPRIELRTNPYTYRAATSQQADSLGGMSLENLMDKLVDEAGDTMSAALRIDWSHPDSGAPNLEVANSTSGSYWNYSGGTWGVGVDAVSNSSSFNIGMGASARGNGTSVGNYGLYGSAAGDGTNYGIFGEAAGGTANYAGFFVGDLVVNSIAGDASVQLPSSSISSQEMLDEPGIAQSVMSGNFFLDGMTAGMVDILSVTLTSPETGYIVVEAIGTGFIAATTSNNQFAYQIDETAGGILLNPYGQQFGMASPPNTALVVGAIAAKRTFFKSAGSYTFRLEGLDISGTGAKGVYDLTLTALFIPTSYGTVSTVVSSAELGDFTQAAALHATQEVAALSVPAHAGDSYQVDLRELEIRARSAEAALEKARREVAERALRNVRAVGPSESTSQQGIDR